MSPNHVLHMLNDLDNVSGASFPLHPDRRGSLWIGWSALLRFRHSQTNIRVRISLSSMLMDLRIWALTKWLMQALAMMGIVTKCLISWGLDIRVPPP
ncbi:hypothetical protein ACFXTH_022888 [Malus domestica]